MDSKLYQNGEMVDNGMMFDSFKVYPNPYVVYSSDGMFTKHYFAEDQRVASKLGNAGNLFTNRQATPSNKKEGNDPQLNAENDFKNYLSKTGFEKTEVEKEFAKGPAPMGGVYYLHGDHLGTATYVTNEIAEPTQFFLNLPFGETMVEQQEPTAYVNPYKFNAKELDSETGLYYYGARYYNPRISIWYGVDPLAVYNPVMETQFYGDGQHNGGVYNWGNLNPYIYTYQNPIRYVDPNGKQVDKVLDGLGKMWNAVNPWAATESTADGLRVRSSHERFNEFQSGTVQAAKGAATKEVGHALLDVGGLLPVVGEPLDGANAIWYASEGDYLNAGLSAAAMIPLAGYAATGTKITVKSLVKTDSKILKLAREAFEGNELLSKEATGLVKQAMEGNFKSGKGAKDIGNGIFELRGHQQGARVYYRMKGQVMEILGYSNKTNQQKVIDAIKKKHAK